LSWIIEKKYLGEKDTPGKRAKWAGKRATVSEAHLTSERRNKVSPSKPIDGLMFHSSVPFEDHPFPIHPEGEKLPGKIRV
jgi:hypothetical protein